VGLDLFAPPLACRRVVSRQKVEKKAKAGNLTRKDCHPINFKQISLICGPSRQKVEKIDSEGVLELEDFLKILYIRCSKLKEHRARIKQASVKKAAFSI
jgi:hypothetical protein